MNVTQPIRATQYQNMDERGTYPSYSSFTKKLKPVQAVLRSLADNISSGLQHTAVLASCKDNFEPEVALPQNHLLLHNIAVHTM